MPDRRVTVESAVGLHARPAALFVQAAARASMEVTVAKAGESAGQPVNAKSILALLSLDVRHGEEIVINAEGEGADEILNELAGIASAPEAADA